MKKVTLIALVVFAAVVAAPIQAKPPHLAHPNKCQAHTVAYEVWGTLVSGSLVRNSDGTYSGTLTVHVTRANNHAKADKGIDKPYTLTSAKANVHHQNPAALTAGVRVHLNGTITTLAKKCDHTGFTPTITIAHADVHKPKHH